MFYYKVVFAQSIEELVEEVNENGRDNWIPQGGVSRGPLGQALVARKFFFQAMIKNTTDD
ncbi:hypothetical protein E2K80_07020 [Rhodophyticola sp. CCM32]|uniref:hypothetical protein n=1 Tax=Rhodophyticola sp. CCM32 TaxID=2916397 RepID=UPI00107F253C|nr:hypothetical protein [Rhodophyticola sp. CCM32]QBY00519.1 hypothetical protein E2K80_07020 [Rhodophyticola sp. CCM32]